MSGFELIGLVENTKRFIQTWPKLFNKHQFLTGLIKDNRHNSVKIRTLKGIAKVESLERTASYIGT